MTHQTATKFQRPALICCASSTRARSCSSISAMRHSSPENLETAIMSARIARIALSLTVSDRASLASLYVSMAAQFALGHLADCSIEQAPAIVLDRAVGPRAPSPTDRPFD